MRHGPVGFSAAGGRTAGELRVTYSPVGCSYLPVAGVSKCAERDMVYGNGNACAETTSLW